MTENKRFTVDYDITVGNYCLHDECKAKGVDGYIAYLSDEERANNLCELLNEQHERLCRFGEEIKMLNFKLHQPIIKGVEGFFKYKPNGNKKDGIMYRSIVSNIYYNDELMTYGEVVDLLNKQNNRIKELETENEKLKGYNKSQELEIVRLHKLADAMSGVLKELGVYDVYDEEQINSVKEKLK